MSIKHGKRALLHYIYVAVPDNEVAPANEFYENLKAEKADVDMSFTNVSDVFGRSDDLRTGALRLGN